MLHVFFCRKGGRQTGKATVSLCVALFALRLMTRSSGPLRVDPNRPGDRQGGVRALLRTAGRGARLLRFPGRCPSRLTHRGGGVFMVFFTLGVGELQ